MENGEVYFENLKGITASFIGDSLFGGHRLGTEPTWIGLLAKKYGWECNNYGSNGCTLSACEGGANPIVSRYGGMADNNPALVVVEGGRNDFNKSAQIGEIGGDITTYKGALSAVIEGLRAKYPSAVIAAVTFWRVGPRENEIGLPTAAYTDAMKEVCLEMGVPCIDATDDSACGVYMTDPEFRREYCFVPGDVCHLNEEGFKIAMPFFERELAKILG